MKAVFKLEKETNGSDPVIETVYVKKRALPSPPPTDITVEITW